MDSRIAIVNRGEPARRLIHAARELNHERGWSIHTIALHTAEERRATFVREADESVLIGRAGSGNPYIDHAELERALRESDADAAWVGWGFVAEDPAFAELCERIGVTFIGPTADAMRRLGDKIGAKLLAEEVGVPVAPWSRGPVVTDADALGHAAAIGYPLMLKATAGGGGRGIRSVNSEAELLPALERTRAEAGGPSVSGVLFLERLVTGARHVEVQVIADEHGTAWALGVRDCSVQRRNQKVIEESASPVLDAEQEMALRRSAVDLVAAVGYRNVGTVEFLYQPEERSLRLPRGQHAPPGGAPDHRGDDRPRPGQGSSSTSRRAAGSRGIRRRRAATRSRPALNAEDPDRDFAPSPGRMRAAGPADRARASGWTPASAEGDVIPASSTR